MKKVKILIAVLIALNIVIVLGCALTRELILNEVADNGSFNIEPMLCLWLEGCITAIAIASFVISLIILGRMWADKTIGDFLLLTCNMVSAMAVMLFIGASFTTDLSDASFHNFQTINVIPSFMLNCIIVSVIAIIFSLATAAIILDNEKASHF